MELMVRIGVDISLHKCVDSPKGSPNMSAEFASRIFHNGVEISPLPNGLFIDPWRGPRVLALWTSIY
jgi:hypothetical protein